MSSSIILFSILLFSVVLSSDALRSSIMLYENTNFNKPQAGRSVELSINAGCTNVPDDFNDLTSSIQFLGDVDCIIAYQDYDCNGNQITITHCNDCLKDLSKCGGNDKLSAVKLCECQDDL